MRRACILYFLPGLFSALILLIIYKTLLLTDMAKHSVEIEIEIESRQNSELQLFVQSGQEFNPEHMQSCKVPENENSVLVKLKVPDLKNPGRIRIDPGLTM